MPPEPIETEGQQPSREASEASQAAEPPRRSRKGLIVLLAIGLLLVGARYFIWILDVYTNNLHDHTSRALEIAIARALVLEEKDYPIYQPGMGLEYLNRGSNPWCQLNDGTIERNLTYPHCTITVGLLRTVCPGWYLFRHCTGVWIWQPYRDNPNLWRTIKSAIAEPCRYLPNPALSREIPAELSGDKDYRRVDEWYRDEIAQAWADMGCGRVVPTIHGMDVVVRVINEPYKTSLYGGDSRPNGKVAIPPTYSYIWFHRRAGWTPWHWLDETTDPKGHE